MTENTTAQRAQVLDYLKRNGKITSMEAIELFGCTRLSGRIHDLRTEGYTILTEMTEGKTRSGHQCRYATYYLDREEG